MATTSTTTPQKRPNSPPSSTNKLGSSPASVNGRSPVSKRTKALSSQVSLAPVRISRHSDEHPEWPARTSDLDKARRFLQRAADAAASASHEKILLVPDKDADGLSTGCIVKRTLIHLGAPADTFFLHHIPAGKSPTADEELESYNARWIIVLDQGSVPGPPLVPGGELGWDSDDERAIRTMILDHHHVSDLDNDCPQGALLVNASQHNPVCTSALLAWCICRPLWPQGQDGGQSIDYLALIGTCGDLSVNVPWDEPWPDFEPELKRWGKSRIGQVIAMINARESVLTYALQ